MGLLEGADKDKLARLGDLKRKTKEMEAIGTSSMDSILSDLEDADDVTRLAATQRLLSMALALEKMGESNMLEGVYAKLYEQLKKLQNI